MVQGRGGCLGAPDRRHSAGAVYPGDEDEVGELFKPGAVDVRQGAAHATGGFRAEVIAHELLHLKVPNHGRVFKALLRGYLNGRSAQ